MFLHKIAGMALKHSIKVPRLYKSAAQALIKVKEGESIKSVINQLKHPNKKGVSALVQKTIHHGKILDSIFKNTEILKKEENLDKHLASILVTELLWGKKILQGDSKPIVTINKYQEELLTAVNTEEFVADEQCLQTTWRPRYVRVNTLRQTPEAVMNYFSKNAWNKLKTPENYNEFIEYIKQNLKEPNFAQDYHIKEMLLFPFGTVFAQNCLYRNGSFVLQDKASCMTTYILNPESGSTILDMCAAPGMKTSHLAAYIKNQGKIYAVEQDKKRYRILRETLGRCKAKCVTSIRSDILKAKIDRSKIQYILLDPSCSGSGMLTRTEPENTDKEILKKRLKGLSNIQARLLRHALTDYPYVKRIVYSTCSVHAEENENVVEEALSYAHGFKLIDCPKIYKQWKNVGLPNYSFGSKCIRTVSESDCTNGFFIAAFERKND